MANTVTLRDYNGNECYPKTHAQQVVSGTGNIQEFVDNALSEYNVSKFHPTGGINGSNKYTLETAIALVPSKYRTIGLKCSFIGEDGNNETWEYKNGSWAAGSFSKVDANIINSTFINVSHLFPTDGYTNDGSTGGDQYTLDEAIQLFVDKSIDDMLRASHGLIFVNKETKKWELWEFKFYTKIGENYKTKSNFRKVITTDDYDELHNKIIMLQSGISKENIYNLQSVNLIKELVYRFFNVNTGGLGEEGSSSVAGAIINMRGIETTDVYFFTLGSFHSLFTTIYVYDEDGNYIQGGISYDESTSNEHLRHFIIPKGVSKIYTQYLSEESVYIQPIETHIPYGITDNSYNEILNDFYYLGKTLESIEIDISRLFKKFKKEVYLKAGQTYRISSDYISMPFRYLDVKGNDVTIKLGATFIPKYDCFYIYNEFINTKDKDSYLRIESIDNIIDEKVANKVDKEPFSIFGKIKKGTVNKETGEVSYSEEGNAYISDFIPIVPNPIIYVFSYTLGVWFYDYNKSFISTGEIIEKNYAYKSPSNAYYMVYQRPGAGDEYIGFVKTQEEYEAMGGHTSVRTLCMTTKTRFTCKPKARNRSIYIVGDSEAARLRTYLQSGSFDSLSICSLSSFGGHSDDMISTNVGIDSRGLGIILKSLKGTKVLVQASTNGKDISRLRAYTLELIKSLREFGANEIWGMSLCPGIDTTFEEFKNNGKYQMQKTIYGGHFIDHIAAVYQMGLYYNLYHPKEFIQPNVGSNVDIYFDDITAFTEFENNPIFGDGLDFYMQYYDEKYDVYTVVSIDEENNKITATLKTNNSDVAPGSAGGQYEEEVSTSAWDGKKITKGFIYNEADKTRISQGKLPYNIYWDHTVHFGKILASIMKELLYAAGAVEIIEED